MAKESAGKRAGKVTARSLRDTDWPVIERLFGEKGACGGCWCMTWRVPHGGKLWEESKGAPNRRAFKKLVQSGKVYGCLAFSGSQPVGWCCIGPRGDFPRLATINALQNSWHDGTWSVTCFYIPAPWRRRGVATALLRAAVKLARESGATELEGYPVKPYGHGPIPAAFAWTSVPCLFADQKFVTITPPGHPRDIYKKTLRRSSNAN